jgi:hypothetical protein
MNLFFTRGRFRPLVENAYDEQLFVKLAQVENQ